MTLSSDRAQQDAVTAEIEIAASPVRVFQALIDPAQVPRWWGGGGARQVYRCTKFEADLHVGGRWRSSGITGNGTFEVSGEFLELDPPRVLSYSWVASWTGTAKTTVRWELIPTQNGTLVRLRHSGLAAHPEIARAYQGWPGMLQWLQSYLDNNETAAERIASA